MRSFSRAHNYQLPVVTRKYHQSFLPRGFLVMSSSKLSPHTIVFSVLDIMFSILA